MHVERNVCASLMGFLLGTKDVVAVRKDMETVGVMPDLHLQRTGNAGVYMKPHAPYVFREDEKVRFLRNVGSTRTPSGYSSTFTKHAGAEKLNGLKSHDFHILMQQLLPATVRAIGHAGVRDTVVRLGTCFQRMCQKVIVPEDMVALQTYTAETLCMLEVYFPPAFFDVMTHLIIHLVEELAICGPVHARWCYPVERYLGHLKSMVRTRARPEAAIANSYVCEQGIGFATEHLYSYPYDIRMLWDMEPNDRDEGEVLVGASKLVRWSAVDIDRIHDFIISNSVDTADLRR